MSMSLDRKIDPFEMFDVTDCGLKNLSQCHNSLQYLYEYYRYYKYKYSGRSCKKRYDTVPMCVIVFCTGIQVHLHFTSL